MAGEIVLLYDDRSPTKERDLILGVENITQSEMRRLLIKFSDRFSRETSTGKKEYDYKAYETLELYGPTMPPEVLGSVSINERFSLESDVLRVEFGKEIGEPGNKRFPRTAIDLIFLNSDEAVKKFFSIPLYSSIRNQRQLPSSEWYHPTMIVHAFSLPSWDANKGLLKRILPSNIEKYASDILGKGAFQEHKKERTYERPTQDS